MIFGLLWGIIAQIFFNVIVLMKKNSLILLLTSLMTLSAQAAPVVNFGQDLTALKTAFNNRSVHILQIGDSHTAGDYFTEQLRKRLQAELGDGGVGFAYPTNLSGQRTARHGYGDTWQSFNSRSNAGLDYPLGGVYALSDGVSPMQLTSRYYNGVLQQARIVLKGQQGDKITLSDAQGSREAVLSRSGWQVANLPIQFPVSIEASSGVAIGGIWLSNETGGVVSAMGINGATQDYWNRWHDSLAQDLNVSKANLVILAYGTNEAFQNNPSSQEEAIKYAISQIKAGLPQATILLVNAPDSLKSTAGSCGTPPPSLSQSRQTIQEIARQYGTLYWDWQEMMGGSCSMKTWISQGLAAKDGVHFTAKGYQTAANDLYDNLKYLLNTAYTPTSYQTTPTQKYQAVPTSNTPVASGRICNASGCRVL